MADHFNEEHMEIQELTQNYVYKLTQIWKKCFGSDMCKENLNKLKDHVKNFYDELITESEEKQSNIEGEIVHLQQEAINLRRLLNTHVELPEIKDGTALLFMQSAMDKRLEHLREALRIKQEEICELLLEQEALCEELNVKPRSLEADPLPTHEEIQDFREYLQKLKYERDERMHRLSQMRREIKNFLHVLQINVSTETEDRLLNQRQITLNEETFKGLQRMYDNYEKQLREMQDAIEHMRKKLEVLWERLETSPSTRTKFRSKGDDCNLNTYDAVYGELQRCEDLKKQNIKRFVQQLRKEIVIWWDKTLKSAEERQRFTHFVSHTYTDDLLDLHEMELEDLKSHYETNQKIFELHADRKILWDRMTALEQKANEPGRYNNRGGQLLKEEKERKTIATKLPKIEQQITDLVREYEEREHKEFLIYGENILRHIANEWEEKRQAKEKISSARKQAQTPQPNRSQLRTPLSARNASTAHASLRKAPSTSNLPSMTARSVSAQKRKLNPSESDIAMSSRSISAKRGKLCPPESKHVMAKRSLMDALSSPSVFAKPIAPTSAIKKRAIAISTFKSPIKPVRVLPATAVRRKSGRHSGNLKKRRSVNKKNPSSAVPDIRVQSCSDSENPDDTYDSFRRCIEPASRSSIIQTTANNNNSKRFMRMQEMVANENLRLAELPNPRLVRTPSKPNLREQHLRTPNRNPSPTKNSSTVGKGRPKLVTKNCPILM